MWWSTKTHTKSCHLRAAGLSGDLLYFSRILSTHFTLRKLTFQIEKDICGFSGFYHDGKECPPTQMRFQTCERLNELS